MTLRKSQQIGVCSWSLAPTGPADLVYKMKQTGLQTVQLALDPIRLGKWDIHRTRNLLRDNNITITSGMMAMQGEDYSTLESIRKTGGLRPDQYWETNRKNAEHNATHAHNLNIPLVSFHAGFIPEDHDDPERAVMINRIRIISDIFASHNISIALETGQETAPTLLKALVEINRPEIGINFDPANMILYGNGNPAEALPLLAHRIRQIHLKDALPADTRGEWGTEVPLGSGAVDWSSFAQILVRYKIVCPLIIEREAGQDRITDIRAAVNVLRHRVIPYLSIYSQ